MIGATHLLVGLSILALDHCLQSHGVISRGDPVSGFATFYGGPQVRLQMTGSHGGHSKYKLTN